MRIGIDYTSAVQQGAGIGRYTRGLVHALAELDRANDYVLFSAGGDRTGQVWPPNFSLRSLPLKDRHLALMWQRLRIPLPAELVTGRVDILHSPDFALPPVWKAHTVLTVHDLSFMRYPECSSAHLLAYLMSAVPRSVRRAEIILADSESTRQDLMELLHVPRERLAVIYPGVEARFAPEVKGPAIEAALRRYGIRRPYILGLGTLQPRKNFCRLIRAFDLLRRQHRVPHSLVIGGGRGWLYEEIYDTVKELGLQEAVLLPGFVADEYLPALYSAAELFAFPSLYEGFGIPVLEAMACGTPVVASCISSLPEVAGDAALLIPPQDVEALADALWRLIDDNALRNDLRDRGFQQASRFTWGRAAESLLEIYKQIIQKSGGRK